MKKQKEKKSYWPRVRVKDNSDSIVKKITKNKKNN